MLYTTNFRRNNKNHTSLLPFGRRPILHGRIYPTFLVDPMLVSDRKGLHPAGAMPVAPIGRGDLSDSRTIDGIALDPDLVAVGHFQFYHVS